MVIEGAMARIAAKSRMSSCGGSGFKHLGSGSAQKRPKVEVERKKKKKKEKAKEAELRIESLPNYGSSLFPPNPGTDVNVISEVLLREITIADGLRMIGGGAGANSLPTMMPHLPGVNPLPNRAGLTFSYLIPITTTAMFESIPIGGHLYTYWDSVGWPQGSYLARRVS